MPDLLQVEQALTPQVRRLEELHCNRAHPAARAPSCPPSLPASPPAPGRARASPPCHPVPGPAPPRGAPEQPPQQPSPGTLQPGHPPLRASSPSHAGWGTRGTGVPKLGGSSELAPCPVSSSGIGESKAEASGERWHLAPSRPPRRRSCPSGTPCQGRAAMGPLLGCPPRSTLAPPLPSSGLGSNAGQEGAAARAPPHSSPTRGLVYAGPELAGVTIWGACVLSHPGGAGDRPLGGHPLAQRDSGSAPQGPRLPVPCPGAAPARAGAPLEPSPLSRGDPPSPPHPTAH